VQWNNHDQGASDNRSHLKHLYPDFSVETEDLHPHSIDLVIPLFNEEEAIEVFHQQLCAVIDSLCYKFTIYYINDGSSDTTQKLLLDIKKNDNRVIVLELSRNFGHQAALTAGIDRANGDFVITMDGDGQHPPELIPEMLKLAEAGYDVVTAQRLNDESASFKKTTSNLFYRLINSIGDTNIQAGAADFRLLKKPVVEALRTMKEYHRLLRGMVAWMGFRSIILPYKQPPRLGGESKYSLGKMLRLAAHATFSFSLIPLYLGISVGAVFILLALMEIIYVLSFWISGHQSNLAPGWSSLMFVLLCVGGSLMITLGFIGIYVGYIFQEVKRRPIYIIREQDAGEVIVDRRGDS
jgi:glycosyltransferase involved in cell wall biosynthesis